MKRYLITILSLSIYFSVYSQIPKSPTNLQSPNTANLGRYGEIPVSLFTGVPQISIPLFSAPEQYNGFSIGLNYHAGGVLPDQHPGWVGTNWSLATGGCISRIVKDQIDEFNNEYYYQGAGLGYYYNYNILNSENWNNSSNILSIANTTNLYIKDTEPDEFTFNFGDYSGKFFLNSSQQWVVQCNKPIKVEFDGNFINPPTEILNRNGSQISNRPSHLNLKTFNSFTITTGDGTKYIFGNNNNSMEYCIDFFSQTDNEWIANSWYLTKINYPNGRTIDFVYERGQHVIQMHISINAEIERTVKLERNLLFIDWTDYPYCVQGSNNPNSILKCYEGVLLSPIYLKTVQSNDFRIEFERSNSKELRYESSIFQSKIDDFIRIYYPNGYTGGSIFPYLAANLNGYSSFYDMIQKNTHWSKLDKIKIYNANSLLIKQYALNFNSGVGATGDPLYTSKERLFLMSLDEQNSENTTKESYIFEYYDKEKLPTYLSNKIDHWGFFNNTSCPMNFTESYYNYREPDSSVSRYGTLKKITYPTGGNSEFIYESNNYSKQLKFKRWEGDSLIGGTKLAGGLRISKIINNNLNGLSNFKEYFYTKNYSTTNTNDISSGILGGQIKYLFKDFKVSGEGDILSGFFSALGLTQGELVFTQKYFSSQSVLPMSENALGSHIGYTEVTEKLSDGSYTRFHFSNFDNGYLDEKYDNTLQLSITPYQPYNSKSQERGNLLAKEVFDKADSLKYRETYEYTKSNLNYVKSLVASSECVCPDLALYYQIGTAYKKYTYSMLLSKKREVVYNNTDSLIKEDNFTYDSNYPIMVKKTECNSNNDIITTMYTYPFHIDGGYLATAPTSGNGGLTRNISADLYSYSRGMNSSFMIQSPIEITMYKNNKIIDSHLFYYGKHNNNYLVDHIYSLESSSSLDDFYRFASINPSLIDSRYRLIPLESYLYDSKHNVIQKTTKGVTTEAYIWGYNYLYPIAAIQNGTYQQAYDIAPGFINYITSGYASEVMVNSFLNSLRGGLTQSLVTSSVYKPLIGISLMTNPRGITTYYEYDPFNRLQYIKDKDGKILQSFDYNYKH